MNGTVFIGVVVALLLIVGTGIAVAWWKLAARAAPYADEDQRARARREQAEREARENTVVIERPRSSPSAGTGADAN